MGRHAPMRDTQSPLPNTKAVRGCDPEVLPGDRPERVEILPKPSLRLLQDHQTREVSGFAVVAV